MSLKKVVILFTLVISEEKASLFGQILINHWQKGEFKHLKSKDEPNAD